MSEEQRRPSQPPSAALRADAQPTRKRETAGQPLSQSASALAEAAHAAANAAGHDGYLDPSSGLFVMTSTGLARRGSCCGKGCRHCPYPPTEQRRAGRPGA